LLCKYYVVNLKPYFTSIPNINHNAYVQDSKPSIASSNTDRDKDLQQLNLNTPSESILDVITNLFITIYNCYSLSTYWVGCVSAIARPC